MTQSSEPKTKPASVTDDEAAASGPADALRRKPAVEIGGPKEADPTRFGDWTVKGRCIDF